MRERDLQRLTTQIVHKRKILAFHPRNEAASGRQRMIGKAEGVLPGVSDWIVLEHWDDYGRQSANLSLEDATELAEIRADREVLQRRIAELDAQEKALTGRERNSGFGMAIELKASKSASRSPKQDVFLRACRARGMLGEFVWTQGEFSRMLDMVKR